MQVEAIAGRARDLARRGRGPRTITNAQLVAALGSETDFKLRAYFVRSGYRSLNYDELTVRKI